MKKSTKEKPHKQDKKQSNKYLFVGVSLFVGLVLLAFLVRGWLRMTMLPKTIQTVHGNRAEKISKKEIAQELQKPFELLGYTDMELVLGDCYTVFAQGFRTEVSCIYDMRAYKVLNQDPRARDELARNAERLQGLLQNAGWEGEYTETGVHNSLKKLVTNLLAGVDYQPDASYRKQFGDVECFLGTNTAFSAPEPPAMATQLSCTRSYGIFGRPSY